MRFNFGENCCFLLDIVSKLYNWFISLKVEKSNKINYIFIRTIVGITATPITIGRMKRVTGIDNFAGRA